MCIMLAVFNIRVLFHSLLTTDALHIFYCYLFIAAIIIRKAY